MSRENVGITTDNQVKRRISRIVRCSRLPTGTTMSRDGESFCHPWKPGAVLLDLNNPQCLLSLLSFEGKLRANCTLSNQLPMVSASGRLFVHEGVA